MPDPAIATAADYADALMTARRAKNVLVLILTVLLIGELAIFFVARYSDLLQPGALTTAANAVAKDGPFAATRAVMPPATQPLSNARWNDVAHYATGWILLVAIACTVLLSAILLLITKIMLIGRLIGVGRLTGATIWSFLLLLLLFPWQTFLRSSVFASRDFFPPGVLYTWDELMNDLSGARFAVAPLTDAALGWARFVVFPLLTIILLLVIQIRSNRGLKQALGETLPDVTSDDI